MQVSLGQVFVFWEYMLFHLDTENTQGEQLWQVVRTGCWYLANVKLLAVTEAMGETRGPVPGVLLKASLSFRGPGNLASKVPVSMTVRFVSELRRLVTCRTQRLPQSLDVSCLAQSGQLV